MYIKSPLNYTGGKFKLLPQIIPLFPTKINTFVDLFGGGANVCINVEANRIIYNDILKPVVELLKYFYEEDNENILKEMFDIVRKYNLSKENEEGYKHLRDDYNTYNKTNCMFYALICHSFNNQIRFNKDGEFNLPFGRRSSFNEQLKKKFEIFLRHIKIKNIKFFSKDFRKLNLDKLTEDDFVFIDPPYLISCATYNERDGWQRKDEIDLLNLLTALNIRGIKFGLTNVLESKGKKNTLLEGWSKDFNVHILKNDFKNSNHQRVKDDITKEVLITNY